MDKKLRPINPNSSQHLERAAAAEEEIARGQTGVDGFDYLNHQWMRLKHEFGVSNFYLGRYAFKDIV